MNAEIFAEWLRRQGYRVVRTPSSFWYEASPHVYQAFPYHWQIEPTESELAQLLRSTAAVALRYSAPLTNPSGKVSYHIVCDDRAYDLSSLPRQTRQSVSRGLEYAAIERIPLTRLATEGWALRRDTLERQGRTGAETEDWWHRVCLAGRDLPGIEAWGAIREGQLLASFLAVRCDDSYTLPYEQSASAHLQYRINHAIFYRVTREALRCEGVNQVFFCPQSLDANPSVDEFKLRMGYRAHPVRQRVVVPPLLVPFFSAGAHALVRRLARQPWRQPFWAKVEGIVRFYREGKQAPAAQDWPACLEEKRAVLLAHLQGDRTGS